MCNHWRSFLTKTVHAGKHLFTWHLSAQLIQFGDVVCSAILKDFSASRRPAHHNKHRAIHVIYCLFRNLQPCTFYINGRITMRQSTFQSASCQLAAILPFSESITYDVIISINMLWLHILSEQN